MTDDKQRIKELEKMCNSLKEEHKETMEELVALQKVVVDTKLLLLKKIKFWNTTPEMQEHLTVSRFVVSNVLENVLKTLEGNNSLR